MLNGNYMNMMAVKKDDLLVNTIAPRYRDVQVFLSEALLTHTIFDLSLHTLQELGSMTAGRYICLMQSSTRKYLDDWAVGVPQAGASNTITLAADASTTNDYYKNMVIRVGNGTGADKDPTTSQYRIITAYNGTTKVATVSANWATTPTTAMIYEIGGYEYAKASYITAHTDVVLTGIKIDAYNNIESYDNELKIYAYDDNYTNKLTISFCQLTLYKRHLYQNYLKNLSIQYSQIVFPNLDAPYYHHTILINVDLNYCILTESTNGAHVYFQYSSDNVNITNCIFENCSKIANGNWYFGMEAGSASGYKMNFYNTIFRNIGTAAVPFYFDTGEINVYNCYIEDGFFYVKTAKTSVITSLYVKNVTIVSYTIGNYVLNRLNKTLNDIISSANVDFQNTLVDWDNLIRLGAKFTMDYVPSENLSGTGKKVNYTITFKPNVVVNPSLKRFSEKYLYLVRREDKEAVLCPSAAPKKIKNLILYENDGVTPYDFVDDEYFLIEAEDAVGNLVYLLWYDPLCETYLSDYFPDTLYTIKHCFQLWRIASLNGVRAEFRFDTDVGANSPLEGSLGCDNYDNEIVR